MTTAQLSTPTNHCDSDSQLPPLGTAARVRFRQPVSGAGFIDAAWWPRSLDLTAEAAGLLDVLWTAGRDVTRVNYHLGSWTVVPANRVLIAGHTVHLGGFHSSDPQTVELSDPWGKERIDLLVIAPETTPEIARQAMELASETDNHLTASAIMTKATQMTRTDRTIKADQR